MPKLRFPHPLTLLVGCVFLAAALTYLLPAGQYQRRDDPVSGRKVVVAGTYRRVPPSPVGPFPAFVAIPRGMASAGSVIFLVFMAGGAFTVVDRTGALRAMIHWLVRRLAGRELLVIPIAGIAFATGGVLYNLEEEIIAFVPVLLLLTRRLGFNSLIVVAASIGSAMVGAAFSPINPFQVAIAQKLAGLPLLSGSAFRMAFLVPAVVVWLYGTMRYAARTRTVPEDADLGRVAINWRQAVVLALVLGAFAMLVIGILRFDWDFDQLTALFFAMGVAAGLIGGLSLEGTAEAFVEGFKSMSFAGLLIGFARAIYVVLEEGRIVDTIVHGLFTPIAGLPLALSAIGMMVVQTAIHFPVPSVSGQAVLTLPVLVPLSDLLGISRQVTVLAYQFGAGLCELLTPTNGALMAMLVASGVKYDQWLRFVLPIYAALALLGMLAIGAGVALGLA